MPVLQTTIRDCRLKSMDVTYSQRSQQREMNKYFITSGCRYVSTDTSFPRFQCFMRFSCSEIVHRKNENTWLQVWPHPL